MLMRLNKIKIVVMNKLRFLFFASILLPLVSIAQEKQNNFEISKSIDIYNNVFRYLNQNYVDEINPAELNETAINAMLKELDPYTVFIPESEIEDVRLLTMGEYGGIGSIITYYDNF
jgi:carboxyl-terminal processing protease